MEMAGSAHKRMRLGRSMPRGGDEPAASLLTPSPKPADTSGSSVQGTPTKRHKRVPSVPAQQSQRSKEALVPNRNHPMFDIAPKASKAPHSAKEGDVAEAEDDEDIDDVEEEEGDGEEEEGDGEECDVETAADETIFRGLFIKEEHSVEVKNEEGTRTPTRPPSTAPAKPWHAGLISDDDDSRFSEEELPDEGGANRIDLIRRVSARKNKDDPGMLIFICLFCKKKSKELVVVCVFCLV